MLDTLTEEQYAAVLELLDQKYQEGYNEACNLYEKDYDQGYKDGFEDGWEAGNTSAREEDY